MGQTHSVVGGYPRVWGQIDFVRILDITNFQCANLL